MQPLIRALTFVDPSSDHCLVIRASSWVPNMFPSVQSLVFQNQQLDFRVRI